MGRALEFGSALVDGAVRDPHLARVGERLEAVLQRVEAIAQALDPLERLAHLLVELVHVALREALGLLEALEFVVVIRHECAGWPRMDSGIERRMTLHGNSITLALAMTLTCAPGALAQRERPETASETGESTREAVERVTRELIHGFGADGSEYWSLTFETAFAGDSTDLGPRVGYHRFLADDLEFHASVAIWGHVQDDDNALSLNPSVGFRYHFVNEPTHSIYADIGIGLLFSTDEVPSGGTRTNFTPRAGLGLTLPVGDEGSRLDLGIRWHHISNASTSGIDDNPDRDAIGVYAGLIIPF